MAPMPGMIDSMYSSMFILVLPCFLVVLGMTILAYRKRNASGDR